MSERKTVTRPTPSTPARRRRKPYDAVPMPIVQTSTYTFADTAEIAALHRGTPPGRRARRVRPLRQPDGARGRAAPRRARGHRGRGALRERHGGGDDRASSRWCKGGQHVVLFRDCYRMTLEFVTDVLARFGVAHTLLAAGDVAALARRAFARRRASSLSESPTNPYLSCIDLERARGGVQGAAHREVDDRRDVRHAGQLPPGGVRHRPRRAQRDEVPRRAQRRPRRRRLRAERASSR